MASDRISIDELLERLQSAPGDEQAWTKLYRALWPFVVAVIYRYLRGSKENTEDAAQEVFLRMARANAFGRIDNADALRLYLWKISVNVARTFRARDRARQHIESPSDDLTEEASDLVLRDDEPDLIAADLLRSVFRDLDPQDRKLLQWMLEGRKVREIAETEGITYSNAGVRIYRLRQKIDNILKLQDNDGAKASV